MKDVSDNCLSACLSAYDSNAFALRPLDPTSQLSVTSVQECPQPIGSRRQLWFPRTTVEPNRAAFGHSRTGKPTPRWVQTAVMVPPVPPVEPNHAAFCHFYTGKPTAHRVQIAITVPEDHLGTQPRGLRSLQYRKAHTPLGPDCRYGPLGPPWNPISRLSVTSVQESPRPIGSRLQVWYPGPPVYYLILPTIVVRKTDYNKVEISNMANNNFE